MIPSSPENLALVPVASVEPEEFTEPAIVVTTPVKITTLRMTLSSAT